MQRLGTRDQLDIRDACCRLFSAMHAPNLTHFQGDIHPNWINARVKLEEIFELKGGCSIFVLGHASLSPRHSFQSEPKPEISYISSYEGGH